MCSLQWVARESSDFVGSNAAQRGRVNIEGLIGKSRPIGFLFGLAMAVLGGFAGCIGAVFGRRVRS